MRHFNNDLFASFLTNAAEPYTLRELEELTGVSAPTLSRLLRGTTPDVDNLYALCAWMDISPGLFMLPQASQSEASVKERQLRQGMQQIAELALRFSERAAPSAGEEAE